MKLRILRGRIAQLCVSLLACLSAGGLLAASIYWTEFDPHWLTFLGGVLVAAVLSLVSQVSRAQWVAVRRARELDRARAKLSEAGARNATVNAAFQTVDMRLRRLGEVLRSAVMFVDRDQVCRFHNHALEERVGPKAAIDGRPLRDIMGDAVYQAIRPHVEESLAGSAAAYELVWNTSKFNVRQLPSQPGFAGNEICLLFTPVAAGVRDVAPPVAKPAPVPDESRVSGARGETLYLRAIAREITGWDDPKAKLTRALAEDKFLLLEQEIRPLDLAMADRPMYEVLLRLQEEEDHLLPPGGFLPEAERFGMLEELDRWVVRHLITLCLARKKSDPPWQLPLYCVNLSASAVRSPGFARFVQAQIEARGFDGRALGFEIGEFELISLAPDVRRLIAMLKPFGCRFTIDAFGSVKGSFAALDGVAADFIKIDGVIVQNLLRDPAQMARARAIRETCCKAGHRTIAEFVENDETLAALRRIGVDYVEGFGVARPQRMRRVTPAAAAAIA